VLHEEEHIPVQIVAGAHDSMILFADGRASCFGTNHFAACPRPAGDSAETPEPVELPACVTSVSLDNEGGAALLIDGSVWVWSQDSGDELADGDSASSVPPGVPVPISGLPPILEVAYRNQAVFALDESGDLWWWGMFHTGGQLVHAGAPRRLDGFPKLSRVVATLAATCGISVDGEAWCSGKNIQGSLGLPDEEVYFDPARRIDELPQVQDIIVDAGFGCAVAMDGSVYCWGRNHLGQLGLGTIDDEIHSATHVEGLPPSKAIDAAWGTACALTEMGRVFCWGGNLYGAVDGGLGMQKVPVPTELAIPGATHIAVGDGFVCALTDAQEVWCAGDPGSDGRTVSFPDYHVPGKLTLK